MKLIKILSLITIAIIISASIDQNILLHASDVKSTFQDEMAASDTINSDTIASDSPYPDPKATVPQSSDSKTSVSQSSDPKAAASQSSNTKFSDSEVSPYDNYDEYAHEQQRRRAELTADDRKQMYQMKHEANMIKASLDELATDDMVCNHIDELIDMLDSYQEQIDTFHALYADADSFLRKPADNIITEVRHTIEAIRLIPQIDETLTQLYTAETDTVADNSAKTDKIFQNVQTEIWKIPKGKFTVKTDYYQTIISKISDSWHYINDDWHYQTGTLKVSIEKKTTSYNTIYYVAHIETFSIQQARSALCGGTYGNPRVTTSEELRSHNAIIGVNGSGFDYGSGVPAPGKSMIKDGVVYSDIYSNGNIMCITEDGGMFTALAGMTTDDMLSQGVRDTFCFGPTLVENGEAYDINTASFHETYRYQRAIIGMVHPGDYYIICADGKGAGGSQGFDYVEMQELCLSLGCNYAYNLDGGGSVTLVFKGRVLNQLTDGGQERPVSDVLYFIDVGDGAEGDEIIVHDEEGMIGSSSDEESSESIWK